MFRQVTWMSMFGHSSPKRTLLWSTSRAVGLLGVGKKVCKKQKADKTIRKYRNRWGEDCYGGTAALKQTQSSGKTVGLCFCCRWEFPKAFIAPNPLFGNTPAQGVHTQIRRRSCAPGARVSSHEAQPATSRFFEIGQGLIVSKERAGFSIDCHIHRQSVQQHTRKSVCEGFPF